MKALALAPVMILIAACSAAQQDSDLNAEISLPSFERQVVDGDEILKVSAGPLAGKRLTTMNPVPGLGDQEPDQAETLCKQLTYGTEQGWQLLDKGTATELIKVSLNLVPGYAGNDWYRITMADRYAALQELQARLQGATSVQVSFILGFAGYSGSSAFNSFIADLNAVKAKVDAGQGDKTYSHGLYRIVERDLTDRRDLVEGMQSGPFSVICVK